MSGDANDVTCEAIGLVVRDLLGQYSYETRTSSGEQDFSMAIMLDFDIKTSQKLTPSPPLANDPLKNSVKKPIPNRAKNRISVS